MSLILHRSICVDFPRLMFFISLCEHSLRGFILVTLPMLRKSVWQDNHHVRLLAGIDSLHHLETIKVKALHLLTIDGDVGKISRIVYAQRQGIC